jgi:hypothetical protein
MVGVSKTWNEKRIEKEEQGSDAGSDHDESKEHRVVAVNMVFQLPDEFLMPETGLRSLI